MNIKWILHTFSVILADAGIQDFRRISEKIECVNMVAQLRRKQTCVNLACLPNSAKQCMNKHRLDSCRNPVRRSLPNWQARIDEVGGNVPQRFSWCTSLVFAFLMTASSSSSLYAKQFLLMIDPAGDAHETGRLIDGVFERSLTLACAQELKQELENTIPTLQVVLTREAGEGLEPLQNAHFANRLGVDLFVRLQFFHEKNAQDTVTLYYFSWGDECAIRSGDMAFIRYDKAHLVNMNTTAAWARYLEQSFMANTGCKGVFAMPCRPLIGITAPAICIEIGVSTKQNWRTQAKNIGKALTDLINRVA